MDDNDSKILNRRKMILNDNIWKVILIVSMPIALVSTIQVLYKFIDTIFVSRIGSYELASVSFVSYINNLVLAVGNGLSVAATTLIAKRIGDEKIEEAREYIGQMVLLILMVSLLIIVVILPFSEQILISMGVTNNMIRSANIYFRLNIVACPLLLFTTTFIAVKRAQGDSSAILWINILSLLLKILSCYVFIVVLNYGVEGLVYSTMIARGIICLIGLYDVFIKESILKISVKYLQLEKASMIPIIAMGIPIVIERSTLHYGHVMVNKTAAVYGEEFIAAMGIVTRMNSIGFSILSGLGFGIVPIISQNIGNKNYDRVKDVIKKAVIMGGMISLIIYFVVYLSRDFFINIFMYENNALLYRYSNDGIKILGLAVLGWGLYQIGMSIFKGFGDTKNNLVISLIRLYLFRIPLVLILVNYIDYGPKGVWIGMTLSNFLGVIMVWLLVHFKYFKKFKTYDSNNMVRLKSI